MVHRKEVTPSVMTRMRRYFVTTDSMSALANSAAMRGSTPCAPSAKFHISVEQRTGVTLSLKHIPKVTEEQRKDATEIGDSNVETRASWDFSESVDSTGCSRT